MHQAPLPAEQPASPPTQSSNSCLVVTGPIRPRERRLRASSKEAYARDIENFQKYGGRIPCDAAEVFRYLDVLRNKVAPATIHRRVFAIARACADGGHASPLKDEALRHAMRWLQRGKLPPKSGGKGLAAVLPEKKAPKSAKPLTRALLLKVLDAVHWNMLDRRDRALLTLGFLGAMKRSTLCALNVEDFIFQTDAMMVRLPANEATQRRPQLAIPVTGGELCAATAVRQLIEHLALEPGTPLFRSFTRSGEPTDERLSAAWVSNVVKRRLHEVGLDPTGFSGESLRRGRLLEAPRGSV